jgi:putative MATE family efflux protein
MSRPPDNSGPPANSARRVDLTQGNILRGIVLLSWPIVSGALLNWVMGVADIKMVGYLGADAIAAVGTSRGAIFVFMAVVFALATGTQVLIARYTGEGNHDRVAGVARQAVILSVIAGAVVTPLGLLLARPLLTALGSEGAVLDGGTAYMQAFMWGAVALMINFMISSALNGAGDTLTPLLVLIFVNTANILFDWLLIFGVGPFPELGVAGAGWAVVISRTIASVILLWVASSPRHAIGMTLLTGWRVDLSVWAKMFYIGVPSAIQGFTRNAAYLMLLWILNHTVEGMYAVAGYTICGQIQMVGVMVGLAFMSAAMTAVGQNMGADNAGRAVRSCWTVARISAAGSALLAAFFIVAAPWLIRFFTQDPEAVRWGVTSLRIMSAALPFLTTGMAFSGGLRGAGDTMSPLYVSLICVSGVGPGLAYLLTVVMGYGPTGAWYGLSVAIVLQAFLVNWVFRRGRWQSIKL